MNPNLYEVLKTLIEMQSMINGRCKIYICTYGEECLKFIVDWSEGFRLNLAVDISDLTAVKDDVVCHTIVSRCNAFYREELEKRIKPTPPVISLEEYYDTRRKHNES